LKRTITKRLSNIIVKKFRFQKVQKATISETEGMPTKKLANMD